MIFLCWSKDNSTGLSSSQNQNRDRYEHGREKGQSSSFMRWTMPQAYRSYQRMIKHMNFRRKEGREEASSLTVPSIKILNPVAEKGVVTSSLCWPHRYIYTQWEGRMRIKCRYSVSISLVYSVSISLQLEVILQSPKLWQQTSRVGPWFLCWKVLVASLSTDSATCNVQVQC